MASLRRTAPTPPAPGASWPRASGGDEGGERAEAVAEVLLVLNFETGRWPSGNPETGYLNCDGGATKSQILFDRRAKGKTQYWDLCFGKRPSKELYNIKSDPDCVNNLIGDSKYTDISSRLEKKLLSELRAQNDPRMYGNGDIFDKYRYANKRDRNFYHRHMSGKETRARWVNKSDFELSDFD